MSRDDGHILNAFDYRFQDEITALLPFIEIAKSTKKSTNGKI